MIQFHQSPRVERSCLYCGKVFYVKPSEAKRGRGKFCSLDCPQKPKKKATYAGARPDSVRLPLVRLEKLHPGDEFYIDNRKGVVVARHLLFDGVRVKMDKRVQLWHRAIRVEPIPAGCATRIDRNGTQKPKQATGDPECPEVGYGFLGDPTRGANVEVV